MANPYDFTARYTFGSENAPVFWDYAFFNGKYYTYFGALPALLMFVPFKALTGQWMPTSLAIIIMGVISIILLIALAASIAKRYFANTASWGMVLLMSVFAPLAVNLAYFGYMTDFYSVPIISSLAFTAGALLLWIHSRKRSGELSSVRIFLGSLLMACNLGCRPQFMIACLLAFPLFWKEITVTRELFSKKGLVCTICAFVPFFMATTPWMWYNYARFGSLLDFGANYNLTGFNMTEVRPSWFEIPAMWLMQLFQPTSVGGVFPFVQAVNNSLPSPNEPGLGGYFMIVPMALIGLLFFAFRKTMKKAHVYGLAWVLAIAIVVVSVVDVSGAGITNRYHGDFAWLAALLAMLTIFSIESTFAVLERGGCDCTQLKAAFLVLLVVFTLFTVFIYGFGAFSTGRYNALIDMNPDLYLTVKSWFMGFYAGQA
ncbi:glycosyltransferase [Bifidobacterium samirii]|uniref:Glycosyltransferase n=2 Tax=Bifidobacterium samirii TaxID=2306974 RepID=A0A430FWG9_9BIFI|nr:glycosyltransferase [Bifidobacterium samirii]